MKNEIKHHEPEHVRTSLAGEYRRESENRKRWKPKTRAAWKSMAEAWERTLKKGPG